MVAKLDGGTALAGVVAYQDSEDETLFHYLPTNVDTLVGGTLQEFDVTYWGIGVPYLVRRGRYVLSLVGATLEGRAVMDISAYQRGRIAEAIKAAFGVDAPTLAPLSIDGARVIPVVGTNTLKLGADSVVKFPKEIRFGVPFNFRVASGSSLFAAFVGTQAAGDVVVPNPAFGITIYGEALFEGPPWSVKVATDLSRVWDFTRRQFDLDIGWGWVEIPLAKFQAIIQEMVDNRIITLTFYEGSLSPERYGREILEVGKEIFEAVNGLQLSEEDFFSFETKKFPATSLRPSCGLSWPWAIFLNAAYTSQSIRSSAATLRQWDVDYTSVRRVPVTASMTLAVGCNAATAEHFHDLSLPSVPCITEEKAHLMRERMRLERLMKTSLAAQVNRRWAAGDIGDRKYYAEMNALYKLPAAEEGYIQSAAL